MNDKNKRLNLSQAFGGRQKARFHLTKEQRASFNRSAEVALAVVAAAGIASVALVAPNVLQAVHTLFLKKHRVLTTKESRTKTAQAFYYLKRSGLIHLRRDGHDWKVSLTLLGRRKMEKMQKEITVIPSPNKWNGKWWLLAADIPTKDYRRGADQLRQKMKQLGFFPLQRTLWIYPFDPRRELQQIAEDYQIERFITVMEINRLDTEDEKKIRIHLKDRGVAI